MAKKIIILIPELIGAGVEGITKAIADNAKGVAGDIILIANDKAAAEAALAELQGKYKALETQFADLQKTVGEPKDFKAKLAALTTQLNEKDTELKDALDVNQTLTLEIERMTAEKDAVPKTYKNASFVVNDETYGFKLPNIHRDGKKITWEMVVASEALQEELVKAGSSLLVKKS